MPPRSQTPFIQEPNLSGQGVARVLLDRFQRLDMPLENKL
jgi:hypothetical protein